MLIIIRQKIWENVLRKGSGFLCYITAHFRQINIKAGLMKKTRETRAVFARGKESICVIFQWFGQCCDCCGGVFKLFILAFLSYFLQAIGECGPPPTIS